jgi:hypothetical protein
MNSDCCRVGRSRQPVVCTYGSSKDNHVGLITDANV